MTTSKTRNHTIYKDNVPWNENKDQFEHMDTESLWDAVRIALMRMSDDVIRCILWERYWNKKTNAQTADLYGIPLE